MRKLLNTISLILVFAAMQAQEQPLQRPILDLDFAHFDRNHLVFPVTALRWNGFSKKWTLSFFLVNAT